MIVIIVCNCGHKYGVTVSNKLKADILISDPWACSVCMRKAMMSGVFTTYGNNMQIKSRKVKFKENAWKDINPITVYKPCRICKSLVTEHFVNKLEADRYLQTNWYCDDCNLIDTQGNII